MSRDLFYLYIHSDIEPVCEPPAPSPDAQPLQIVAADYHDGWLGEFTAVASRYGVEDTFAMYERKLAGSYEGKLLLGHIEREDWSKAAECALAYVGDRQGKWSCR